MRRHAAFLLAILMQAIPAFAIFGVGDVVFDPSNFEEAAQQLVQLEQQYRTLVQTYQTIRGQYDQMLWMAKSVPVTMATRYRALATPWVPGSATNTYGTTAGWVGSINTGINALSGYTAAIQKLEAYGSALANIPSDQLDHVKTSYATVELTDGANLAGIQTLGQLRANAPAVEAAIANLENDSLSSAPEMNTEIAVLNKINAASVIGLRNAQDSNKLLVTLAEEQIVQAKRERDAEARMFDQHIRFMSEGRAALAAQNANASSAMTSWHMP
jgi:hypothetical protein